MCSAVEETIRIVIGESIIARSRPIISADYCPLASQKLDFIDNASDLQWDSKFLKD